MSENQHIPWTVRGRWKILVNRDHMTTHVYGPYWTRASAERAVRLPQFRNAWIQIVRVDVPMTHGNEER